MFRKQSRPQPNLSLLNWNPVSRVWPILTRPWVRQQSRTSGAGALKPYKNRRVRHYTMDTTAQSMGYPAALSLAFKNYVGCAIVILCILDWNRAFQRDGYGKKDWLFVSKGKESLFCWPCLMFRPAQNKVGNSLLIIQMSMID